MLRKKGGKSNIFNQQMNTAWKLRRLRRNHLSAGGPLRREKECRSRLVMRLRIWVSRHSVGNQPSETQINSLIYWISFEQIKYSLLLQFRWLSFPLRSTRAQLDTATDRDLRVVRSARCRGDVQFISSTVSPDDHCHSAWLCFLNQPISHP